MRDSREPLCVDIRSARSKLHWATESRVATAPPVVHTQTCTFPVRLHGTESTQAGRGSTCALHAVMYRLSLQPLPNQEFGNVSGGSCCLVGTRGCSNRGRSTPGSLVLFEARLCNGTGVPGDGWMSRVLGLHPPPNLDGSTAL